MVDKPISVGNGTITTIAPNPKEYDSTYDNNYCYYNRGIIVNRSNTTIHNIEHKIVGEDMSILLDRDGDGVIEKWGDEYDIVLAGGFVKTRSPYNVYKGNVTYSDLCSILPFDNCIVLCSIQGKDLKAKFINTDNEDYYISYGDYDLSTIKDNQTYYIVVDQYTSSYGWNNITELEVSGDGIYARDLVADFISKGSWA